MRGGIQDLREMQIIADSQTSKKYEGFPKTKEEWIQVFETWWDPELLNLVKKYSDKHFVTISKYLREHKDYTAMINVLNTIWCKAPDGITIHSDPGWNVLCDLCSESYLMEE
jgi:uncharacterized protein YozE (UPF0346 family)